MPHGVDLLRCLERVRSAQNTEESTSCTLSIKIEPDSRGLVPGIHVLFDAESRGWPGQAHGCPVRFLWTGCMTWILLCFERFAHVRDTEGDPCHAASE